MFPTSAASSSQPQSQRLTQQQARRSESSAAAALLSGGGRSSSPPAAAAASALVCLPALSNALMIKQETALIPEKFTHSEKELMALMPKQDVDTSKVLPWTLIRSLTDSYEIAKASGNHSREQKGQYREESDNMQRTFARKLAQREEHASQYAAIDDCKAATAAIGNEIPPALEMHADISEHEKTITDAENRLGAELNKVKKEKRLTIMHLASLKHFAREQAERELALAVMAKNDPESHARLLALRPKYAECLVKISETSRKIVETQSTLNAATADNITKHAVAKEKEEAQRKAVEQAERICTNTFGKMIPRVRTRVMDSATPVHCVHCNAPLKEQLPVINKRMVEQILGKLPSQLWEPIKAREDEKQQKAQEEKIAAAAAQAAEERAIRQLDAQQRMQQQQDEQEYDQQQDEEQKQEQQLELDPFDDDQQQDDQYLQDDQQQPQEGEGEGYDAQDQQPEQQQDDYAFDSSDPYLQQPYQQSPSEGSAGSAGQFPSPYDRRMSPFDARASPYGMRASPYGLQTRPYGQRPSPYDYQQQQQGQRTMRPSPYGFSGASVQGAAAGTYGQRAAPYGRFSK